MNKAKKNISELPEEQQSAGNTNLWTAIVTLIKAFGRWLRPAGRRREITYRTKQQTQDGYTEKEITYRDEY
jgi:hypothetical protein